VTSKSVKRARAEEKRERMLAVEKQIGLDALQKDREFRDCESRQAAAVAEERRRNPSDATRALNSIFGTLSGED